MEIINMYMIEGTQYELYRAASGDYCVTIEKFGKNPESFNLGSKEDALAFILTSYEVNLENLIAP